MAKQIGQAMAAVMDAVALPEQSTKDLTGSEAHKRKFLETFRRWEILFKRKDGRTVDAEKWLIAEYYDSLGHLSAQGFDALTKILKEECIFFPSIKECLDRTRPNGPYDFSSNCLRGPENFVERAPSAALSGPSRTLAIERHHGPAA